MVRDLTILYRGPLASCNYDCHYCPFAKRSESTGELEHDRAALARLLRWTRANRAFRLRLFFTPWGEALVRHWYREAIVALSRLDHVAKIAVQTNLSCPLDWLRTCDARSVALWCTFHPAEVDRGPFLRRCRQLDEMGIAYSVGIVGLKENFAHLEALRRDLPDSVYLWINAYKREPDYYDAADLERLTAIDPLFPTNAQRHPSLGRACRTGESVICVDGEGTIRRCHFITQPLGNLYTDDLNHVLQPRRCTNQTCGCHIGYVHLAELELDAVYGDGILERIPMQPVWRDSTVETDARLVQPVRR